MSLELLIFIVGLAIAALVAWLALAIRRAWKAFLLRRRMRGAASGEELAERWLTAHGHRILGRQLTKRCTMWVNGLPITYDLRADLLVELHQGDTVLVEVKTGDAADPASTLTRRQLREYAAEWGVDRLYLFDATRRALHEVAFETANAMPSSGVERR